jgi:hypothetical protein
MMTSRHALKFALLASVIVSAPAFAQTTETTSNVTAHPLDGKILV